MQGLLVHTSEGDAEVALPTAPTRRRPVREQLREEVRAEQPETPREPKPVEIIKKLPLLPPKRGLQGALAVGFRKMAEIPLEEASVRLRLNLMLFQRGKGDSPIVSPRHMPEAPKPQVKLPEMAKLPVPHFSSRGLGAFGHQLC